MEVTTLSHTPLVNKQPSQYDTFVRWIRHVAPYVHALRGNTFVVAFGGELVQAKALNALVHDLSLLNALGVRLVLVHGSRPQVNQQLKLKNIQVEFDRGMRITDAETLACVKECAGAVRLDIEAAFSQGLPNTPMQGSRIKVISGNFITARPVGIIDGVDFKQTGQVRKIDTDTINHSMDLGAIVLLSTIGFSPTGEAFNLAHEDIATQVAVALKADKLIFLTESEGIKLSDGNLWGEISRQDAEALIAHTPPEEDLQHSLRYACDAVRQGVERAHLVPFSLDGSVLLEVFTHDGVGTMIVENTLGNIRPATIDDVGAIVSLIEPLEADGTLVKRGRGRIERDIEHFTVIEHDGVIFACAALYSYPHENMAEMACLIVHPERQGTGEAEKLLKHMEIRARKAGISRLFVLTTRTAHWFIKRGFSAAGVSDLPQDKQASYDTSRNSKIFIKDLS